MVEVAKGKEINKYHPVVGDICDYKFNQKFDAIVGLFHVLSYLTENDQLINCFKCSYDHLKPGGVFLFDVWYSPAVLTQVPEVRIKRLHDGELDVTRLAEPFTHFNKNVVDVNYEFLIRNKLTGSTDVFTEKHPMRYFSIPEIQFLATQAGFEFVKAEEFLTGNLPSESTWGVCFALRKN
jgi:SAM-dependent methyltransferase